MPPEPHRVLILAYGNPGRRDDGLGPALGEALRELELPGVTVEIDLQLQLEDVTGIAAHDLVIFVDAAASGPAPFSFQRVRPGGVPSFTTHSVSPAALMALAREHFRARASGWVLAVRGHEFDGFGEGLGARAASNLADALRFLESRLRSRRIEGTVGCASCAPTA